MKTEALFFNSEVACEYGIECAVFLSSIAYWCKFNKDNGKHQYDGSYWTYNSVQAFGKQYPWWSEKTIRNVLKKLIDAGLIKKGEFNKTAYDRTAWYSLTDKGMRYFSDKTDEPKTVEAVHLPERENGVSQKGEWSFPKGQMEFPEMANGSAQKGEPIPDINTNINTDEKADDDEATSTAPSTASSFSFSDLTKATVIFTLPTSEGDLAFTDEDVKALKEAFNDLDVLSELKQMALKLKLSKQERTLDHTRNFVTSWLIRSQNNRASGERLYASPKALAPEDPNNERTHPKFDRDGNELDYNGNIVKTAKQRREEQEEARRKEIEASPAYKLTLELLAKQEEELKAKQSPAPQPAPETNGKHPWEIYLEKMKAEKEAKAKAEMEAENYRKQHPETTNTTESITDFKKRVMRTAQTMEQTNDTGYF